MPCSERIYDCTPCKSGPGPLLQKKKGMGVLAGIILVVLPKCPFCVLAFSSTMVLCGKGDAAASTELHSSMPTLLITLFFCILTIATLLLGYKGRRTWYAVGLAVTGSTCIIISVLHGGGQSLYYTGVAIILAGIAFNMKKFRWMEKMYQLTSHIKNKQL